MLTVTYLLQNPKTDEVVAYFSLQVDANDDTRLLYFDLKPFKDAQASAK